MDEALRIGVLGAGSWGTTLGILLSENGHRVTLWEFDGAQAERLGRERENKRFLPGVALPASIHVTAAIAEAARDMDVVVLAVPSHTMRGVCTEASAFANAHTPGFVVNVAKGIEEGTTKRMSEVIAESLPASAGRIVSLVGPSHAEEVSRRMPTSVVVAGGDTGICEHAQAMFLRPYFRVYTNGDLVGVELAVALKNCIAIAAGIIDGLGFGDNTKAALVTRGLAEMTRLGVAMGARAETFSGLAGVGDLVVTCLSRHSRNRHVGEAIGRGKTLEEVLKGMVMVAEGVRTTRGAVVLGRRHGVELPIIEMVHDVLFDGFDPGEAIRLLMTRPTRAE